MSKLFVVFLSSTKKMTGQYNDEATVAPPTHAFNSLVTHHFSTRHYTISITGSCILLIPYNTAYCRLATALCPWNCIAWFDKSAGRTHEHGRRACNDSRYSVSDDIQGVSKRALQLWKLIEIYTEDIHNVLNCQIVAKHTEFYLGVSVQLSYIPVQ